jgi:uncharacterized protein (TIGR02996 family)
MNHDADGRALMRAILEEPDADFHRLAYADWLEDRGEPEHAGFIRDCCLVLARHTDCPTRLRDAAAGRPVPPRCGACEYCLARRRGERFCARHPWIDLPSYAVAFEPTPLDGEILAGGGGPTLVVRRGFVAEVALALADFERHARDIFSAHPVERVALSGRAPYWNGAGHTWYDSSRGVDPFVANIHERSELPPALFVRLEGQAGGEHRWRAYPSRQAALDALSAACVAFGRSLAGLPPPAVTLKPNP